MFTGIKIQLLFIFTTASILVHGQVTDSIKHKQEIILDRSLNLLTGLSFNKYIFAEVGLSKNSTTLMDYHSYSDGYFVSSEIRIGDKFIIGPKIGIWASGGSSGLSMGLNMIYYTNFNKGSLIFRPEIGIGQERFKFVYGYNAILTKYKLGGINRNLGSIVYLIKFRTLKNKVRKIY